MLVGSGSQLSFIVRCAGAWSANQRCAPMLRPPLTETRLKAMGHLTSPSRPKVGLIIGGGNVGGPVGASVPWYRQRQPETFTRRLAVLPPNRGNRVDRIEMTSAHIDRARLEKVLLTAMLSFNVVVEAAIALGLLVDMPTSFVEGFQVEFRPEIQILGLAIASLLMVHIAVNVLAILWTRKNRLEGIVCAYVVGAHMIVFGLAAFLWLDKLSALLVDGGRGVVTVALAFLVWRKLRPVGPPDGPSQPR